MKIRPIDATDDAFAAWFDVYHRASYADYPDHPLWRERELRVVYVGTEHRGVKLWLAEDDGQAVGAAVLTLPLRDNLSLAEPDVYVPPEARRRGIGSALLRTVENAVREAGRGSILSYIDGATISDTTPGTVFAEHHGFTRRTVEIIRVQRPDAAVIDAAAKAAHPHAVDYRIVTWRDRAPDEHVHEVARLEGRLSTDAPLDDLDYEGEVWDEARIRTAEERTHRMGRESWSSAAIAADGVMAGRTEIDMPRDSDDYAFQGSTIVDPAHRGHRLGLLLKAVNAQALLRDRPGVRTVWTWNAGSNAHMIAINETLGYRPEGWCAGYQRDLDGEVAA